MTRITDENYQDLANAIVERGLKDLIRACRGARRTKSRAKKEHFEKTIMVIEKQLRSEWCLSLTNLDMDFLIERVTEKWKQKGI